jgi:cytochrome P450
MLPAPPASHIAHASCKHIFKLLLLLLLLLLVLRWLGEGLVSELDASRHAAARDVLAPAFRAQSVKDLVPLFADVAQQLASQLLRQAGDTIGELKHLPGCLSCGL